MSNRRRTGKQRTKKRRKGPRPGRDLRHPNSSRKYAPTGQGRQPDGDLHEPDGFLDRLWSSEQDR